MYLLGCRTRERMRVKPTLSVSVSCRTYTSHSFPFPVYNRHLLFPKSELTHEFPPFPGKLANRRACFDPTESSKMWQRMSASEGGKGLSVDFLSTHPANAKRIKQLENWMPEVSPLLPLLHQSCPSTLPFPPLHVS